MCVCVCVDWMWLFPAESKVQQLAGWYLWVTGQTLAGRKGTEDGQHDDWIPESVQSICFGLNTEG